MRLLEHEAKGLLGRHGAPVPIGQVVASAEEQCEVSFPVMAKVQVPVGGRGKAGGIVEVVDKNEYATTVSRLLETPLKGYVPTCVLLEEKIAIQREMYLALLIDRDSGMPMLLAHKQGGVEIEMAEGFLRESLHGRPTAAQQLRVCEYFELPPSMRGQFAKLLGALWKVFEDDALLVEINPLVITSKHQLVCADAKIELDSAAAFRHPRWQFAGGEESSQFALLNSEGTIATMANGAGLAMATVDAVHAEGALPANFFDVGGGTDVAGMIAAFQRIAALPSVAAIVVNIFAGITRCDQVAEAIVAAKKQIPDLPELYIRLTGTNEQEGREILTNAAIPTLNTLDECVSRAVKAVSHV